MGFIICLIQQQYGLVTLNGSTLVYPVKLELTNFIGIVGTVLVLGYITSFVTVKTTSNKL